MAEDYGIKIAKQGFDVKTFLTELNKKNFNILSTEDTLLRKELSASSSDTNMFLGYVLTPDSDSYFYFGEILTVEIANAGLGYTYLDLVDVAGGDSNAKIYIDGVDGGGGVTSLFINVGGSGYSTASGVTTSGGTGSGFTVNITSVVSSEPLRARPLNFSAGEKIYIIYENAMPS